MLSVDINQPWFYWSIVILVAFPLLTVSLAELGGRLEQSRFSSFRPPLAFFRAFCLPLLFLSVLLRFVVGLDSSQVAVRIVDTVFWIILINFALAILNIVFFQGDRMSSRAPKLLLDLLRFFLVALAAAVVISTVWGVDLGRLLAALGVGSIVIGLALQDTLGSLFAGIAMVSSGQKRVGDWVNIAGEEGVVENLNWRAVTLRTVNGDRVVIPNSMVSREKFVVYGAGSGRRTLRFDVWFAYDHPPQKVLDLLVEAAHATDGVIDDPPPAPRLSAFDDRGIRYFIWFTVNDVAKAAGIRHQLQCNLWYAAQRQGFVMPAQHHAFYRLPAEARTSRSPGAAELAQLAAATGAVPRSAEQLAPLMKTAAQQRFRQGEILTDQGMDMRDVFIVLDGVVEAHDRGAPDMPPVAVFESGQIIVFKSIFRSGFCPFQLKATREVMAIAIPAPAFKAFLASDPRLAEDLEEMMDALDKVARRHRSERAKRADRLESGEGEQPELQQGSDGERGRLLRAMFRS